MSKSQREVMHSAGGSADILPLVSVRVVTYNHEKWIAQCLESILMQRTDFPFEVIVGEDCSTDRTREIVLAYERKYPDRIRVITSETNVGLAANALRVLQSCRGKYHAFCEGDDYWIDPLKLQKQVDFLEAHPDVTLCFHNVFAVREDNFGARLCFTSMPGETLTFAEAAQIDIPMVSIMVRSKVVATLPEWRFNAWCPDVILRLWCAHLGNLGYLNEAMSVYRKHSEGLTAKMKTMPAQRFAETVYLYQQFDRETACQHTDVIQTLIKRERGRAARATGVVLFSCAPASSCWAAQTICLDNQATQRFMRGTKGT